MKKIIRFSGLLIIVLLSGFCNVYAQKSAIIKGHVTDALTGSSMEFVNVVEIDKNGRFVSGTISDLNGNYIIKVSDDKNPLQASFIGYRKQNININGKTQIDIKLQSEDQTIGEVRIGGTKMGNDGFTKVRDRATSVARIDMKDMKSLMSTSVEDLLQGRMGNVDISSISGDPGAGLNIRIRGTATLNARNNPLIVINGIPYDAQIDQNFDFASADVEKFGNLIDVSPEDIETIEVLKDAASTAAWGSRAANGVLMIKTKRGIKSKPIFEYTFKNTIAKEPKPIPMLDGAGYARLITEEYYNVSRNVFSDRQADFRQISFDPRTWESAPVNLFHNYSQNTDWIKEITQIAHTKQHDFSVRGGGEKSRYNMSVGFFDETGTTINNGLKKLNLRSSLDYDLSSKLQFKSDIMFTRYDQYNTFDAEDEDYKDRHVRSIAYRRMPNLSVMFRDTANTPYGDYFIPTSTLQGNSKDNYNPVAFAKLGQNKQLRDNARALFTVRYSILDNLIFNSTVTLDIFDNKREKFLPYKAIGYSVNDDISNNASNEFTKKSSIYTINQLIYNPKLGEDHDLAFMGLFDTEETLQRGLYEGTSRSASPYLQQPIGDKHINDGKLYSWYYKYRSMGMFGNVNYKFKDKYIFSAGVKYEGNSKYSAESRWGLFPTVSGAWRVNKENFLKDVAFINDLKLRLSWGQTGNSPDEQYLYFKTYKAGSDLSYMDMHGVKPEDLELTSLMWETIDQINPGLTFYGLDNRINVEIDYYKKTTLNLYLKDSEIPDQSGFATLNQNNGELENRGMEFMIDYTVIRKRDFELSFNLNLSNNKNLVIRLPENVGKEPGNVYLTGGYRINIQPGEAMGGFFGYRYLGVYAQNYNPNAVTAEEIEKNKLSPAVQDKDGNLVFALGKNVPLNMIMGGPTDGYVFEAGDARYDDVNHDGKIDELDLVYLGDLNPKAMGGFGNSIRYKGFVVNSFFYFKVGQKIINQTRIDTENMKGYNNQSKATNWRWRREGDVTDMPRAVYDLEYNSLGSDRFVEDGSYLRLKTLSLSYNFTQSLAQKLKIKDLKVYTTAYNLYTWTRYSGQDPDVAPPNKPDELPKDESRTPPSRKILIGVNITF